MPTLPSPSGDEFQKIADRLISQTTAARGIMRIEPVEADRLLRQNLRVSSAAFGTQDPLTVWIAGCLIHGNNNDLSTIRTEIEPVAKRLSVMNNAEIIGRYGTPRFNVVSAACRLLWAAAMHEKDEAFQQTLFDRAFSLRPLAPSEELPALTRLRIAAGSQMLGRPATHENGTLMLQTALDEARQFKDQLTEWGACVFETAYSLLWDDEFVAAEKLVNHLADDCGDIATPETAIKIRVLRFWAVAGQGRKSEANGELSQILEEEALHRDPTSLALVGHVLLMTKAAVDESLFHRASSRVAQIPSGDDVGADSWVRGQQTIHQVNGMMIGGKYAEALERIDDLLVHRHSHSPFWHYLPFMEMLRVSCLCRLGNFDRAVERVACVMREYDGMTTILPDCVLAYHLFIKRGPLPKQFGSLAADLENALQKAELKFEYSPHSPILAELYLAHARLLEDTGRAEQSAALRKAAARIQRIGGVEGESVD